MKPTSNRLLALIVTLFLASCSVKSEYVYMQTPIPAETAQDYEPILQKDDVLSITVSSENPEASAPFNLNNSQNGANNGNNMMLASYIIDINGEIEFPILGKIKLDGLKKSKAIELLREKLSAYLIKPTINMRILNFKVSLIGETGSRTITSMSERLTILEAISQGGDISMFGNRKNIRIIRDNNGVKTVGVIDITKSDFMNSPYYYLQKNDVIYVEPKAVKITTTNIMPYLGFTSTIISLSLTIYALFIKK